VAEALTEGKTNKEIAAKLFITEISKEACKQYVSIDRNQKSNSIAKTIGGVRNADIALQRIT
jgi:FixJ family two-component response regulator